MARADVSSRSTVGSSPDLEAMTVDAAALEALLGLATRTIRQFAQDCARRGASVRGARGKYRLAAFLRAYIAAAEAKAAARDGDEVARAIDAARARKFAAEAERLERDLEVDRGELISVSAVRQEMRAITMTIRAQLLSIPGRYAVRTVGLSSVPESMRVWDRAIRDILAELREDKSPEPAEVA